MQGFNRGQGCTKRRILNGLCFEIRKRLLAVRGGGERLPQKFGSTGTGVANYPFLIHSTEVAVTI
ncbi:MAG: hypothetical protein C4B58_06630 [Deltaproteobacteria bacterium]|nr:MAG: hypothetical protein C4B58_06630 [Deltaproteobacteria bacterium]